MDSAAGASREQLQAQYEALRQIEELRVTYDVRGIPKHVFGRTPFAIPQDLKSPSGRAALEDVIEQIRPILLSEGTETLTLARDPDVQLHLRDLQLVETIRGIPVRDGTVGLTVDDRTGHVIMISATFLPDRGLAREPKLTADDAVRVAKEYLQKEAELRANRPAQRGSHPSITDPPEVPPGAPVFQLKSPPALGYRMGPVDTEEQPARLVWAIHFEAPATLLMGIVVDAIDGSIVGTEVTPTISRAVHDSAGYSIWGPVARIEGQPPIGDAAVNSLYDNVGWALTALDVIGGVPTGLASASFDLAVRNTIYGVASA